MTSGDGREGLIRRLVVLHQRLALASLPRHVARLRQKIAALEAPNSPSASMNSHTQALGACHSSLIPSPNHAMVEVKNKMENPHWGDFDLRFAIVILLALILSGCNFESESSLAPFGKAVSIPDSSRYNEGFKIRARSSNKVINGKTFFLRRTGPNKMKVWTWNTQKNKWDELYEPQLFFSDDQKFIIAEFEEGGIFKYHALFPTKSGYQFLAVGKMKATENTTWTSLTNTFISTKGAQKGTSVNLSATRPDHALAGNPILDFDPDRTLFGSLDYKAPTEADIRSALSKRLRDGSMGLSAGMGAKVGTVILDHCKEMVSQSFICYYKATIAVSSDGNPLLGAMLSLTALEGYKYASFKKGSNGWYVERIYHSCDFKPDGKVNCKYAK